MNGSPGTPGRRLVVILLAAALGFLADAARAQAPASVLILNDDEFRPGETLALGVHAVNPGFPTLDLYIGVVLADGQSVLLFQGGGGLAGPFPVTALSAMPPFGPAPPGFSLVNLEFFQFTFPQSGVAPGTYQLFAALVRPGALADNRIDPGDVLAAQFRPVTFGVAFSLNPAEGPSGTAVTALGSGFAPGAQVTVGGVPASSVVVSSASALSFVIPFVTQGAGLGPLAAGAAPVRINGGPAQTFAVTAPPPITTPPGSVLQGQVSGTATALSSSSGLINQTLSDLSAQAASQAVTSYTTTMQGVLGDLETVLNQDLANLGTSLDTQTATLVDQGLSQPENPTLGPRLGGFAALPGQFPGDDFLSSRRALIAAASRAEQTAQLLAQVCPSSPNPLCAVAAAAFSITSLVADLLVGATGNVVALEIQASQGVSPGPGRLLVRLRGGDIVTLVPFLVTRQAVNGIDPAKLARHIQAARAFIAQALGSPGIGPGLTARLNRLANALSALAALAPTLTADVPLGADQQLPLSFGPIQVRCPLDLFTSVAVDTTLGQLSVIQQAAFDVTRICEFGVRSAFLTLREEQVSFAVAISVAAYGSLTFGPPRPAAGWAALLVAGAVVLSQVWQGRRPRRPPRR